MSFPSLASRPNNLPAQTTPFIGRESDLAAIRKDLLSPSVRLLTLTGAGGTGKTRLALQVAADLLDDFDDGVFFVALAPIGDPALVIPTIVQTLDVREVQGRTVFEALQDWLRDRHLLLLLDNFEHLIANAPTLGELLNHAPNLKIVVTSREGLRLYGEHDYPVSALSVPDLQKLPPLEQLTRYEAVQLFVERAKAVKPEFRVDDQNAHAVAEICYRLEGLPLAIELAAARVRLLPPQKMLAQLSHRLQFLTGGARDLPARQQTLRRTLDWSYQLLIESEKSLFGHLAVFAGGWTLDAAEAVCADDVETSAGDASASVLNGLQSLLDKNLLKQTDVGGEPRFSMLETIREYAGEKLLASGQGENVRKRHLAYFVQFAEEAEPKLYGAEQVAWLTQLEAEHDNFRAALASALANGDPEMVLRLASAIERFWDVLGYWSEGRRWLAQAVALGRAWLAHDTAPQWPVHFSRALNAMSRLAERQGEYAAAQSCAEESLRVAREVQDRACMADALTMLGGVELDHGEYAGAQAHFEESLALSRELGDRRRMAVLLVKLGNVAGWQNDLATARTRYEESLAAQREGADKVLSAQTMHNLGLIASYQGDYMAARSLLEKSLALGREVGDKRTIGLSLMVLGHAALRQGDQTTASARLAEGLPIIREIGERRVMTYFVWRAAEFAFARGQWQRAAQFSGAFEALTASMQLHPEESDRKGRDQRVATLRAQLGNTTFDAAWEAGEKMTLEQAIAEAEQIIAAPSIPPPAPGGTPPYPAGLTEREVEVLRLLSHGWSNAEIAEQLVVSPRTVGAHLRSIFNKLDVTSRTAAARVAVELKLV